MVDIAATDAISDKVVKLGGLKMVDEDTVLF